MRGQDTKWLIVLHNKGARMLFAFLSLSLHYKSSWIKRILPQREAKDAAYLWKGDGETCTVGQMPSCYGTCRM